MANKIINKLIITPIQPKNQKEADKEIRECLKFIKGKGRFEKFISFAKIYGFKSDKDINIDIDMKNGWYYFFPDEENERNIKGSNIIYFSTANKPAIAVISKLATLFPKLTFKLEYSDEHIGQDAGFYVFTGNQKQKYKFKDFSVKAYEFAYQLSPNDLETSLENIKIIENELKALKNLKK